MTRTIRRILKKFRASERGSAIVEITLVTPLMISIAAGVFEFGYFFHKKLLVEAGLRDAARYAARCNASFSSLPCETNARNIAVFGNIAGTGTARVPNWTTSNVTVNQQYSSAPTFDPVTGDRNYRSEEANVYTVRASTTYNYSGIGLLSYLLYVSNPSLNQITINTHQEERYVGW